MVAVVLAGLEESGMVKLVKEGECFGEEWLVLEFFEVEPLAGFDPP